MINEKMAFSEIYYKLTKKGFRIVDTFAKKDCNVLTYHKQTKGIIETYSIYVDGVEVKKIEQNKIEV